MGLSPSSAPAGTGGASGTLPPRGQDTRATAQAAVIDCPHRSATTAGLEGREGGDAPLGTPTRGIIAVEPCLPLRRERRPADAATAGVVSRPDVGRVCRAQRSASRRFSTDDGGARRGGSSASLDSRCKASSTGRRPSPTPPHAPTGRHWSSTGRETPDGHVRSANVRRSRDGAGRQSVIGRSSPVRRQPGRRRPPRRGRAQGRVAADVRGTSRAARTGSRGGVRPASVETAAGLSPPRAGDVRAARRSRQSRV